MKNLCKNSNTAETIFTCNALIKGYQEISEEDLFTKGEDNSGTHLDDRSWIKSRIRFNMQLVEDFQQVKEDRDLDKREKAYYNEQIEEAQEKVRVLTKLAQEMAEGVGQ